jgi:transcription antitermination factor NusG
MATKASDVGTRATITKGNGGWLGEGQDSPTECCVPRWYAVYMNANHEKHVADQLRVREVEFLLPTYSSVRRWKDRRVNLKLPLFPGYVFVRVALRDRLRVLKVPGVVRLVGFGGTPCALPQEDIDAIQGCLDCGYYLEPHPYLQVGRRARVKSGPLQGLEGIILRKKNRTRFVLSFEIILRSVAVEIDGVELEPVNSDSKSVTSFCSIAQAALRR